MITGSSLELPCLTALPEFATAPKRWTFNGNSCQDPFLYLSSNYVVLLLNCVFFFNVGIDISSEVSGSVRIKKNGLFLFISPITGAHQGQYVCSVNESSVDILQTYDITVTGEKHAVKCVSFIFLRLQNLRKGHCAKLL